MHQPITLAIIDIDHFKLVNDTYGHQAGDECLKEVAAVLRSHKGRPSDFCARYGGEEFAFVFGSSTCENVMGVIEALRHKIHALAIPNVRAGGDEVVTVSAGIATMYPCKGMHFSELVVAADKLLYQAKNGGKNQTVAARYPASGPKQESW